jgi:ABC-type branched-subunit amino acid transport system substrate-binding protein
VLFLENETTRFQTEQNMEATEQLGYNWIYSQSVQIAETNYNGFVLDMIDAGVEFLYFQGDYSQAVRLANAMRQQNYWPEVYALQTNIYTQDFLDSGGSAIEGSQVAAHTALLEEIDQHEELQLYREWLQQVDPSAEPTSLGMLGWSAMKLIIEGLKEIGPEVTREAMLDFLDGVSGWDANGLTPPQEIGAKQLTSCTVIVEVVDGTFQRVAPSDGFLCEDALRVG